MQASLREHAMSAMIFCYDAAEVITPAHRHFNHMLEFLFRLICIAASLTSIANIQQAYRKAGDIFWRQLVIREFS